MIKLFLHAAGLGLFFVTLAGGVVTLEKMGNDNPHDAVAPAAFSTFTLISSLSMLKGSQEDEQKLNSSSKTSHSDQAGYTSSEYQENEGQWTEEDVRLRVFSEINHIRSEHGLSQLEDAYDLESVARDYSQRMLEQNFFSHVSPDGDDPQQRVNQAGIDYRMVGENLAHCQNAGDPVRVFVDGWMKSPGHRANILNPNWEETGIGIYEEGGQYYATQLFMARD